jgi:hypothetical protein
MKKHAKSLLLQLGVECRCRTAKRHRHWRILVGAIVVIGVLAFIRTNPGPSLEPRWLTITAITTDRTQESLRSFDFPIEPFLRAQIMVEEAIGPSILSDPLENPLRNCSVTTQFRLWIPPMASDCWILQSFHGNGTPKLYGGDEIYVEWIADDGNGNLDDDVVVTGVALVTDQQDGTYALDFVTPPLLQLEKDTNNGHRQSDPWEWSTSASGRLNVYSSAGLSRPKGPHEANQRSFSGLV